MILCGKISDTLKEESTLQFVGVPDEGMGPIFAVQINVFPGTTKLCPITVIKSPVKGDCGWALAAVGESVHVDWPDTL